MENVEALLFDVFGTVVDWRGSVEQELRELIEKYSIDSSGWEKEFAQEWRTGYMENTRRIAAGGSGTSNVDQMHREILDRMLDGDNSRWGFLSRILDETERTHLNNSWHRLHGWSDSTEGLYALKKQFIIATLSNGNIRLLTDMAKHTDLPWDVVFSTELFNTYKPNPKAYLSAAHHLSIPPEQCAMVAAHIEDLRAAAKLGLKTIYIPRPGEDGHIPNKIISKLDGGEVDIVTNSFMDLASILGRAQPAT